MYDPMQHPDESIGAGDWQSEMFRYFEVNEEGTEASWRQLTGVVYYDVFAFASADDEEAVATARIPQTNNYFAASAFNETVTFDLSALDLSDGETYYLAIQGIVPRFPVNVAGVNEDWGVDSPVSERVQFTFTAVDQADPFAGAASWALPYLPDAYEEGLLSERMFGAWTDSPTRLEAAADIVRFAQVFTNTTNLEELYEYLGLDFDDAVPFPDTDDENARFLKAAGISTGNQYGNFDPEGSFTRAAMVVMIYRLAMALDLDVDGFPLGSESFTDVPDWPQHEEAIGWAAYVGITDGVGGGLFNPLSELQNQHVAVFAMRALTSLPRG